MPYKRVTSGKPGNSSQRSNVDDAKYSSPTQQNSIVSNDRSRTNNQAKSPNFQSSFNLEVYSESDSDSDFDASKVETQDDADDPNVFDDGCPDGSDSDSDCPKYKKKTSKGKGRHSENKKRVCQPSGGNAVGMKKKKKKLNAPSSVAVNTPPINTARPANPSTAVHVNTSVRVNSSNVDLRDARTPHSPAIDDGNVDGTVHTMPEQSKELSALRNDIALLRGTVHSMPDQTKEVSALRNDIALLRGIVTETSSNMKSFFDSRFKETMVSSHFAPEENDRGGYGTSCCNGSLRC